MKLKYVTILQRTPSEAEVVFRHRVSLNGYSPNPKTPGSSRIEKIMNEAQSMRHYWTSRKAANQFLRKSLKSPGIAGGEVVNI
jgi:hypothetical protein